MSPESTSIPPRRSETSYWPPVLAHFALGIVAFGGLGAVAANRGGERFLVQFADGGATALILVLGHLIIARVQGTQGWRFRSASQYAPFAAGVAAAWAASVARG